MSFAVRDGRFDIVVAAGPRVHPWPSAGVRALSAFCAEIGLSVGLLGGDTLVARGAIPLPGTGALVLAEDLQQRIHRIQARAVVRLSAPSAMPDPFPGWRSQGLIPLATALLLMKSPELSWSPCTVILGTGNQALRFGAGLLESGAKEAICVETSPQWGAKRFSGWEVERRRFEMAGGKLIEGRPVSLTEKSALTWELRIGDAQGVRVLEVARVVSAGPFGQSPGVREYPPGSFLFELEQTSGATRAENVEGWDVEEERGRWLAEKIAKALVRDLGEDRERLEKVYRRARGRMKRYFRHREEPFTPAYQGKWIAAPDSRRIRSFSGVPQHAHQLRAVASVECFEEIPCNLCEKVCPESAIDFSRSRQQILHERDCTACGLCLNACPSNAISLIHERESQSLSQLTLPWRGGKPWSAGELAILVNRRGESLGSARVSAILPSSTETLQLVQLEVPTHLVWEARGLRRAPPKSSEDESYVSAAAEPRSARVGILLNGEKRLVREKVPVSVALFEIGQSRAEDALICSDGSCGLCHVTIDGIRKLACTSTVHRGMAIRVETEASSGEAPLCPCLGIRSEQVVERIRQGKLRSPEAVVRTTHVGEGRCHGQVCGDPFRRLLAREGIDASQWIDWRFPWSDWVLTPKSHG